MASILWRRLDTPGHDACRLVGNGAGWTLDGRAVFKEGGVPVCLTYHVGCDLGWRTLQGQVYGWLGLQSVEFSIARTSGGVWTLNGAVVSSLAHCVDLDLGFTPATNLLPLRRLALAEGQAADASAAWLEVRPGILQVLPQRYERRSETTYWYEAPLFDYAALLEVDAMGFIRRYPGLWEIEDA
ncbi:MAG: putative glycolipid-binding domain-containing protein [Gemmatimonadaceae bacterium]